MIPGGAADRMANVQGENDALRGQLAAMKRENEALKASSSPMKEQPVSPQPRDPGKMKLSKSALSRRVEAELHRINKTNDGMGSEMHNKLLLFQSRIESFDDEMNCDEFISALLH
jgi:hypothetical protein